MTEQETTARFERIEAVLDRTTEQHAKFQLDMGAAIMVQQEQIAEIRATQAESARQLAELTRLAARHEKAIASLEKQLEAYLRSRPQ